MQRLGFKLACSSSSRGGDGGVMRSRVVVTGSLGGFDRHQVQRLVPRG